MSHTTTAEPAGVDEPRVSFVGDSGTDGDVRIVVRYPHHVPGEPDSLTVPKRALLAYVAGLVVSERVSRLEGADPLEVLGLAS